MGSPDPPGQPGRTGRTSIYRGRVVDLYVDTVRFPDGSEGQLELMEHRGASAIVAFLDPPTQSDPRILLIRQYRYATSGYLHEVPAGIREDGDASWEACAIRELEEETGYRAGSLRYLTEIWTTPGFTNEIIRLYAAWDLEATETKHDADEFLEVEAVPFSHALARVRAGDIRDGKTVAALLVARHAFIESGQAASPTEDTNR